MLTRIPIKIDADDRSVVFTTRLDGIDYRFRLRHTMIDDRWRLWILDESDVAIVGPLRLVPGMDLLLGHKHNPRVPQGELFVWGPSELEPPTAETADVSSWLVYRSPA